MMHQALKHRAELAHHVPGRLRVKVPTAVGHAALLEDFKTVFEGVPGIESVLVRPQSGSIVVLYDPRREPEMEGRFAMYARTTAAPPAERPGDEIEDMARKIEAEAEFLAEQSRYARAVVDFFKHLDREIKLATGNVVDLKILLAVGLAVVTFAGIGAAAATPMWVTLALFTLNNFMQQHSQAAAGAVARRA